MAAQMVPDLDAPTRALSLSHTVAPNNMIFLHRGQTQQQLVKALYTVMHAPQPSRNRIWLLASEFEVISTFLICAIMLIKKRSLGKLWIITKRDSPHGSFYVANAVFVLVLGVSAYLVTWDITALVIAAFSFANISSMEWWWVIPLPWLPLVIGAYVSIHGFAVGCSPRSPLSALNGQQSAARKWYYLPVPKWPALVNTSLILPCVLFFFSTIGLVAMSGFHYYHAKALAHQILPADILLQVHKLAHHAHDSFADEHLLASDDLIWLARRVAAAYFESHRYVSINLAVYAAAAFTIFVPCVIYGLPNIASLVDHACSRHPEPLPPACTGFCRKLCFLLTKGKPTSEHSVAHLNLGTWKMTFLAVMYIAILVSCVPAFAFIPVYIVAEIFPKCVLRGDIEPVMTKAVLAVSLITIASCTFVAVFCTVATLDPLFRAAIGLNMIRNQVPIDITVVQHKSRHEEVEIGLTSPTSLLQEHGLLNIHELHSNRERTIGFKPSMSTLQSATVPEEDKNGFADYPVDSIMHIAVDDVEAASPTKVHSIKRESI
ncbi:hypothetical protein NDA16_002763 [Ustilago loliicola]|nr:hypothetical protein NDA16_002763 [Ustilago loliicola]